VRVLALAEQPAQVAPGELPFERVRDLLVAFPEGEEPFFELTEQGEVVRRERLELQDREVDLHLIEPARMDRRVDADDRRPPLTQPRGAALGASMDLRATNVPRREVRPCARALVLVFDAHRPAWRGRRCAVGALSSLDARLLVGREDAVLGGQGPALPATFVEV